MHVKEKLSVGILSQIMKQMPSVAYRWHNAIVLVAVKSGADRKKAHESAATFMRAVFGIDTHDCPEWVVLRDLVITVEAA